jgi:hypothetical protein
MKLLKFFLVICLTIAAAGLPCQADEESSNLFEISLESMVWSRYLDSQGSVWSKRPISISDITISLRKTPLRGLYFNCEVYTALDKTAFAGQNFSNEIDLTLGFAREIKGIQVDFGVSYFDIIPLINTAGNVWAPYVQIGKEFKLGKKHSITPYVQLDGRIPRQNHVPQNGIFAVWGIKHSWQITESLSLKQKVNFLYDSGAFGLNEALLFQYRVETRYEIHKPFFVKPLAIYFSTPLTKVNDGRKPDAIFGAGLGCPF